ncbi:hypothetical protein O9992_30345 [Vibrio lentus]|nr:hypothetical protein [Vibrio lentus]
MDKVVYACNFSKKQKWREDVLPSFLSMYLLSLLRSINGSQIYDRDASQSKTWHGGTAISWRFIGGCNGNYDSVCPYLAAFGAASNTEKNDLSNVSLKE